jgi:hypothetical protein
LANLKTVPLALAQIWPSPSTAVPFIDASPTLALAVAALRRSRSAAGRWPPNQPMPFWSTAMP